MTNAAMLTSKGQSSANKRAGGVFVTRVTTRPMNQGTALSLNADMSSTTNKAANSHFAWRAKCHRNAMSFAGGSGFSGAAVGVSSLSKSANILDGYRRYMGRVNRPSKSRPKRNLVGARVVTTAFLT